MATTHFPTQIILKEYNDNAVLNITKENQEADVYWVTVTNEAYEAVVTVNLYKPCLIEIYSDEDTFGQVERLKVKEIKYANSFSVSRIINDDKIEFTWAKVYL